MEELLLLHFELGTRTRTAGAVYYRVSGPDPLDDRVSWFYYEANGADVYTKAQLLGPVTAGGESNLFTIPYDADRRWRPGQYHAALPPGRRPETVALELFGADGRLLRRDTYRLGALDEYGPGHAGPAGQPAGAHDSGPHRADRPGADWYGADRYGADRFGPGLSALTVDPLGVDSLGAESLGVDPVGVDSTGIDPQGADAPGADAPGDPPSVERNGGVRLRIDVRGPGGTRRLRNLRRQREPAMR